MTLAIVKVKLIIKYSNTPYICNLSVQVFLLYTDVFFSCIGTWSYDFVNYPKETAFILVSNYTTR